MALHSKIQRPCLPYFLFYFLLILILGIPRAPYAADLTNLPTLDIQAAPNQTTQKKSPSNDYDFTQQKIQQSGSKNLSQFLAQQGLVSVKNNSSANNQETISMHGFGSNANQNSLIQIDNIPDISLNNVSPVLNTLMLQNISSIDVLPGSYGANYGNQAVGGMVNINTLTPNKTIHELQLGLGNNNQALANIFYSQRYVNQVGVNLGFSESQNNHSQDHENQDHTIANGKLDYIGERGSMSLNFLGYQDRAQIPGYFTVDGPATPANPENIIKSHGALSYFKSDYFLSPDWSWKSAIANNNSQSSGFLNTNFQNNQSQWLIQNSLNDQKFFTLGHQIDLAHYDSESGSASEGNTQSANEIDNDFFTTGTLPIPISIMKNWDINLGLRYANQYLDADPTPTIHTTKNSNATVSTEGLTWHIAPSFSWYARRAGSFLFAKGNEQMWTDSPTLPLETQTGVSYETGINWQQPNHSELKVSLYQLDINHEISMFTPVDSPFPIMSNLPPTRRLGVDALEKFHINTQLELLIQGTLVSPRFRSGEYDGKQIPSVSPLSASTGLSYQSTQNWNLFLNESYNSSYYADGDFDNTGPKQAGYFLTNLNMTKTYHQAILGLAINNLLNQHFASYAYAYGNNPTQVNYYMGDGLSILGSLTLSF